MLMTGVFCIIHIEESKEKTLFLYDAKGNKVKKIKKDVTLVLQDKRTKRWVKRPVLALQPLPHKNLKKHYKILGVIRSRRKKRIPIQLELAIQEENCLKHYLEPIIKKHNLPLFVIRNKLSGRNQPIPGDLHIYKTSDNLLKCVIELLQVRHSSVYIGMKEQKDILKDRSRVKKQGIKIHYVIAYDKPNLGNYGFYIINAKNKYLFKNKTSMSLTKLREQEIDITEFLKHL